MTESGAVEPPAPAGPAQPAPVAPTPAPQPYGPGAEAKLRQTEGQSKQSEWKTNLNFIMRIMSARAAGTVQTRYRVSGKGQLKEQAGF